MIPKSRTPAQRRDGGAGKELGCRGRTHDGPAERPARETLRRAAAAHGRAEQYDPPRRKRPAVLEETRRREPTLEEINNQRTAHAVSDQVHRFRRDLRQISAKGTNVRRHIRSDRCIVKEACDAA